MPAQQPDAGAFAPLRERREWVRHFRKQLATEEASLRRLIADETGKSEFEALTSDILPLLAALKWLERRGPGVVKTRRVGARPWWQPLERQRVSRVPAGRVAIIATWNYPVQLLGIQMAQALFAGNRVVVKPSEHAPRTQARLIELAQTDLPDGVLTSTEPTRAAGPELLASAHFDHIVFTGSTSVGREVAAVAAQPLTPSTLELSGRDSAIVLADADPQLAAREIFRAFTDNAGQTCMAPRRALVHRDVYEAFVAAIAPLASGARPRRLVSPEAADRAFDLAVGAVERGGRSLSGVLEDPTGASLRPLVIVDCPADATLVAGDHFGPVLAVIPFAGEDEALAIHRATDQHLATSVFTSNTRAATMLVPQLGATSVTINEVVRPTGNPGASIGGRGPSGWGLSRGREGLLAMTRPVFVSVTPKRLRTPSSEGSPRMLGMLSRVMGLVYGARRGTNGGGGGGGGESRRTEAQPDHTERNQPEPIVRQRTPAGARLEQSRT